MTKADSKKIIKLAQLLMNDDIWHPDWRSSKTLPDFIKITDPPRLGYVKDRKDINFMLATKERRQFFDAYIKLMQ
jgi:hypothetical protein